MTKVAPKGLGRDAAAFWQAVMREFVLDVHEIEILTAACRCLDETHRADAEVEAEGLMLGVTRGARRVHPLLKHARDSRLAFANLIDRLHLDKAQQAPAAPVTLMRNRRMVGVGPR